GGPAPAAQPGGSRVSDLFRGCWSVRPSQKTATHSASRLPSSRQAAWVPSSRGSRAVIAPQWAGGSLLAESVTPKTRKPKFISTVSSDWQASSVPPPQPPDEEKAQAILPSTFIQWGAMVSSQNRFIFQDSRPMLVGLPSANPSHQSTSSAVASSTLRRRTSMAGMVAAPSATSPAIFAVFPLAESNSTSTLPIVYLGLKDLGCGESPPPAPFAV